MAAKSAAMAAGAAALLAACTYQGPPSSLPEQRLTWLSYLGAADVRAACAAGQPDRLRIVYNAGGDRTRAYDLVGLPDGGAVLDQRVDRGLAVGSFDVGQALSLGAPVQAQSRLTADQYAQLRAALANDGAFGPPPVGLTLRSDRFYWLVTSCLDGQMRTTAFRDGSADYDGLAFPALIARHDATGLPFVTPQTAQEISPSVCRGGAEEGGTRSALCFTVTVGEDGLSGL
ncbi:MAG: hypothetical protein H6843_12920 [Rhodospirillaceae bacterium]|nr:hypothetical protein [Rhodospirillaceae bacterium]